MALTVVEHLMALARFEEAMEATEVILRHSPRNALALANQGKACFQLLSGISWANTASPSSPLRLRYARLLKRNRDAFAAAQALGWEPID
jgi:hypothetical protein